MTAAQIITLVDETGKYFELTYEGTIHLKRFFLLEYCNGWLSVQSIANLTKCKHRISVYRSVQIIQTRPEFRLPAHRVNQIIKAIING